MEKFQLTNDVHNKLCDTFEARAKNLGLKGKKYLAAQAEFFLGAVRMLDIINGDGTETAVSPMIAFSIMRGERIEKLTEEKEVKQ